MPRYDPAAEVIERHAYYELLDYHYFGRPRNNPYVLIVIGKGYVGELDEDGDVAIVESKQHIVRGAALLAVFSHVPSGDLTYRQETEKLLWDQCIADGVVPSDVVDMPA